MPRRTLVQQIAVSTRRTSSTLRQPPSGPSKWQQPAKSARPLEQTGPRKAPPSAFARSRALPWVLSSLIGGVIAFYGGALLVEARKPCQNPAVADISQQKNVTGRYDDTADSFDSEVGFSEFIMGVNRMRKELTQRCTGHVLEVSCGTGRNLGYYNINRNGSIQSLTFVDVSPQMVELCKKKWNVLGAKAKELKPGLAIRFLTASALESMPPPPAKNKYDTIIQTMGLCSTPSPKDLLLNMVRHLDTSNPAARILLLEHGRSYRSWMNNILDNAAEKHAEVYGCWFNRDIGALVKDAARQTGLQVVSERRHHLGTTWIFELKPGPEIVAKNNAVEDKTPDEPRTNSWKRFLGLT